MHLFINALAASAGSGPTYVRNVVPHLAELSDIRSTVMAARGLISELGEWGNVSLVAEEEFQRGPAARFWREQWLLPKLISRHGADALVSAGNFALFNSPVPQILLTGNSLYTSADFARDVLSRRNYRLWLDTRVKGWLAKQSVRSADWTVTPSQAFAAEIKRWFRGRPVAISAIPHGFDREIFFAEGKPLPSGVEQRLAGGGGSLRLLFVSYYNYFRNFETLVRAIPLIKGRLGGRSVKLVLTCELRPKPEWGPYNAADIERLVGRLGVATDIIELGLVPYRFLHQVYRACDIYVTPSYAESFAHPLVEAMASGLPIVASDLTVHREVCRDAALYFPRFSSEALAERVTDIATSPELTGKLSRRGLQRSSDFSWQKHVADLITLAETLVDGRTVHLEQSNKESRVNNELVPRA